MKTFILLVLTMASLGTLADETRALIGRCSYDNQTGPDGKFRAGFAIANFYRATDGAKSKLVVAEGISLVPGSLLDKQDKYLKNKARADQGLLWPSYEVSLDPDSVALHFSGSWVSNLARGMNPAQPVKSEFSYGVKKLGTVIASALIPGSFLQNTLGQPNGYPVCVFWESPVN